MYKVFHNRINFRRISSSIYCLASLNSFKAMFDLRGEYSPTELGENVLASFRSNNCLMSSGVPSASAAVVPKLHCGSTMPYARNTVSVCLYKIKSISIIHVSM